MHSVSWPSPLRPGHKPVVLGLWDAGCGCREFCSRGFVLGSTPPEIGPGADFLTTRNDAMRRPGSHMRESLEFTNASSK
jgi:hypothetical protein